MHWIEECCKISSSDDQTTKQCSDGKSVLFLLYNICIASYMILRICGLNVQCCIFKWMDVHFRKKSKIKKTMSKNMNKMRRRKTHTPKIWFLGGKYCLIKPLCYIHNCCPYLLAHPTWRWCASQPQYSEYYKHCFCFICGSFGFSHGNVQHPTYISQLNAIPFPVCVNESIRK